jgi:hypothetical protein
VSAAPVMQGLVDVSRMGYSSLEAHSADIHQSEHFLPWLTAQYCISPNMLSLKLTLSVLIMLILTNHGSQMATMALRGFKL